VGLVAGYDFLIDASQVISGQLAASGSVNRRAWIGNNWTSTNLAGDWLDRRADLASFNVHANHWALGTPDNVQLSNTEILSATADMSQAVYFSLGCHAGLNVPDQDYGSGDTVETLDLPQVFMRGHAAWIGNTGYGIGGDGTPLSEQMAILLGEELTTGTWQAVGTALALAKQQYYTSRPETEFGFEDEKVMSELTLYGLPMAAVQTPRLPGRAARPLTPMTSRQQAATTACSARETQTYTPLLDNISTADGAYYSVIDSDPGSGAHALDGQPIQPQLVKLVGDNVRGVVLEGGLYITEANFDPVVTRLGNSHVELGNEQAITSTTWLPAQLPSLRWLETLEGYQQTLVLRTGQFFAPLQTERVYTQVTVSLYSIHLPLTRRHPPLPASQPRVMPVIQPSPSPPLTIRGVCRVLVTYSDGQGAWQSIDLNASGGNAWVGDIPQGDSVSYFVQVVDQAGNVSADNNGGLYYSAAGRQYRVYLPLVLR